MKNIENTLLKIANTIKNKVIAQLILGPGNTIASLKKTGNWSSAVTLFAREKAVWKKEASTWVLRKKSTHQSNDEQKLTPLQDAAVPAALGFIARGGNCGEEACLALFYLMEYYEEQSRLNNKAILSILDKLTIHFLSVMDPLSHVFLQVTYQDNDTKLSITIDPWVGIVYSDRDNKNYNLAMKKTSSMLLYESFCQFLSDLRDNPIVKDFTTLYEFEIASLLMKYDEFYNLLIKNQLSTEEIDHFHKYIKNTFDTLHVAYQKMVDDEDARIAKEPTEWEGIPLKHENFFAPHLKEFKQLNPLFQEKITIAEMLEVKSDYPVVMLSSEATRKEFLDQFQKTAFNVNNSKNEGIKPK